MFLFNINTPLDHSRSRRMKGQDLGTTVLANQAQSNNLEKDIISLKRKMQRTPDTEKKLAQLTQDLTAQMEKVRSLTALNQSYQAAAASASEERDKAVAELESFVTSSREKDEEHKGVLAKVEESLSHANAAYERMLASSARFPRDAHKTGEADLKARMEEMKGHHKAKIKDLKLENADLAKRVEDLRATKVWLLTEGAQLLAKHVHKGPEMTQAVAAVNNAMSEIGVNFGVHGGYIHALKKKNPYAEVPLLNRNAEAKLNMAIACFDYLSFCMINGLS
ncbi:hypothetical protein Hanom_Chr05g00424901 [Helianthus anomalus]